MAARAFESPRVRVAALIILDGRLVCVRHRSGRRTYHLLPGGGVGYRETIADALKREVFEETGLEISVGRPLFVSDTIDPTGTRHVINLTFAADVIGGAITSRPSDKRVEGVELVEPDHLTALDLRPPMADSILDALGNFDGFEARYLGPLFTEERPRRTTESST